MHDISAYHRLVALVGAAGITFLTVALFAERHGKLFAAYAM
jgi:hypothetical protein